MTTAQPAIPEPDDKDWTWVIHERCPDCGFDPTAVDQADVPGLTRHIAATIADALSTPEATVRPEPTVWSPVEYACHVRDVCGLFRERLDLMVTQDDPEFADWNQDTTAIEQRYWTQQPDVVAAELRAAAELIAEEFAAVHGAQWQRPGRRSNGSLFTVDTFARYFLHDVAHHAWDVTGRGW